MLNRSHIVWVKSSIDLLIAALAILVSLQYQSAQSARLPLSAILAVRLTSKNFLLLTLFLVFWTGIHQLCGHYSDHRRSTRSSFHYTLTSAILGSLVYLLFPFFSRDPGRYIATPTAVFCIVAFSLTLLVRLCPWPSTAMRPRTLNTVIVGSGPIAVRLSESLAAESETRRNFLGFVDSPAGQEIPEIVLQGRLVGTFETLEDLLASSHVDEVLIALPLRSCYDQAQQSIAICERIGVPVTYHFQPFTHKIGFSQVLERALGPFLSRRPSRIEQSQVLKRALDITLSASALLVLSPVFLATALAIRLNSRGPAFFVQERYGLNRQRFKMWKFRTMVPDAEARQTALESKNEAAGPVFKIKNDPRVTSLGRFLRKTSLDELPQLFNVLRGEMSLVGPRPLPLRDVTKFSEASLMRRFSVKPGLTCLWQIKGRSNTDFDQWIAFDLEYIDTWTPFMDFKIVLMTIPAVVRGSGAM